MSSCLLVNILSEEAYQSLSSEVKNALEDHLAVKLNTVTNLEGEIQRIKADYEQKCYELDKKFIESASRLDSESSQNEKATARCNDLEKQLEELRARHKDVESTLHDFQNENTSLRRIKDNWDEDRLSLEHVIQKRDLEISNLNEEWKKVSERLLEATNSKNELQLKLDEISSSEVTSLYHLKRLEQEKNLLSEQNSQLNENLNQKTQQLLGLKKEKENEIISLRGELDLSMSEAKQMKDLCETMKKNESSMQNKMNELQEKFTKMTDEYNEAQEMHRNQIQSLSRLAELYRESAGDAEKKSEELISAVEELQGVVKGNGEEMENLRKQLSDSKTETQEFYKETEKLKKELEGANDLIAANKRRELSHEELSELCPTAALTSKFIKSGMTLTQIYSQYVEQTDELIVAKEENKRLNEAMDSILNELNEKAPLLKRQREDYERALTTISDMTTHSDQSAIEFQQLRQDADDSARRNQILKSDNERLRKEASDLSKQVCFLLREVEELRGRQVLMSPQKTPAMGEKSLLVVNDDGSCNDVSSSSELISQTLVTFRDIAELQEQNQKLLAVIRKLSDEQETADKSTVDSRIATLQHEVEMAKDELEHLRDDRSRQIELVETVVRQRDMYRVLLAQNPEGGVSATVLASPSLLANTSWMSNRSTPVTPTGRSLSKSPRTPDLGSMDSMKKALAQLQEEYTEYKKEVLDNNKVFEIKTSELQDELLVQKGNCAKLDAQLEFSKERYEIMKTNIDSHKKEADSLRNRNQQLYSVIQQHERNISSLSTELTGLRDSNNKFKARLETSQREMEICKRAEERVAAENASLQREHRSQMVLLANLQKMQQSMETQSFEVKSQLNSRIEAQEREIKALRQNNQNVLQNKQDQIQSVERQLYVVQKQFDSEQLKAVKLTHELSATKSQTEDLERENHDVKSKLTAVEDRLVRAAGGSQRMSDDVTVSSDDHDTIKILRQQLVEKTSEIAVYEMRLEKLKQHADHFKVVSVAAEESIKQTNDAHKELLESLQARLEQSNQQLSAAEQRIIEVEEENSSLKNEKYKVTGDVEKQTAELQKQLMCVRSELESALRRQDEAIKNEQIAVNDLKQQVARAEEANDNYQREMMLHATVMQQLLQFKEKVKNYDEDIEKERSNSKMLDEQLREKVEAWSNLEEQWKNEAQQMKHRYAEVEDQNKILHDQMQSLSGRLVELQSKVSANPSPSKSLYASRDLVAVATAAIESGDTAQSSQQLLDVIKFLRREKEISDTKSELVQSEVVRCKQQILQLEKQIFDLQEKLETEQKRALKAEEQITGLNALKREVAHLRSSEEQNKTLRAEREQIDSELRSSNNRIAQLQEDLAPLQAKNREFSSQVVALLAEKKSLMEEAERWKERVQQMTQSPRRQDPEEYRRLIQEKTTLTDKVDSLNKELTESKSESSKLNAQARSMETELHSVKSQASKLEGDVKTKEEEVKRMKAQIDEKSQTINRIRKVGRRFKLQYEELLKKQQEAEKEKSSEEGAAPTEQEQAAAEAAKKAEESEAVRKQAEANLFEERARLQAVSQELSRQQEDNKTIKSQLDEATKKLNDVGQSQSELQGENVALRSQSEELSKNIKELTKQIEDLQKENKEFVEKDKKFTRLLGLARKQLEKSRKENQDNIRSRDKLQEDLNKIESEKKSDLDMKTELQAKIDELQRQLNEGRASHPSSIQTSERKAAAVRPTSAQQVNQVKPMRVTRTARVMPEPQQEAQDSERPGPSSASQAPASSTQVTVAVSAPPVAPVSTYATAFVYPMSPARQQSVGSSVTSGQGVQQSSTEGGEGDHAIVSSSDDQTVQDESSGSLSLLSSTPVSEVNASEGEASSSSGGSSGASTRFVAPSSSAAASASAANQSRPFHLAQKRSHEGVEEVSRPGSSGEAQVAVAPLAKRQRPDQSSERIVASPSSGGNQFESLQSSAITKDHFSSSFTDKFRKRTIVLRSKAITRESEEKKKAFDSREVEEKKKAVDFLRECDLVQTNVSSALRQPDQSQQPEAVEAALEVETQAPSTLSEEQVEESPPDDNQIVEEVSQSKQNDVTDNPPESAPQQSAATSSSIEQADDVIVLSSDEENDFEPGEVIDMNDAVDEGEDVEVEADPEMADDVDRQIPSTTRPEIPPFPQTHQLTHSTGVLPPLTLPQDSIRPRFLGRPAPLTPGIIVPSSTDDDGIVPCTPTLIPHRHDDSYQAMSSPFVGSAGAIRFQFDDVTQTPTPTSLAAVPGGLASVDNTIMDLAGAGGDESSRSVPSVSSSSTAVSFFSTKVSASVRDSQLSSSSSSAAVSSSIQEEFEECEESDQTIPSNIADASNEARSSIPSHTARGRRRFRVIGAPRSSRGKGINSPTTSNQP